MTQDENSATLESKDGSCAEESQKLSTDKKEKNAPPSKVVIRRLPPSMTLEMFLDQISPVPENDYLYFTKADFSLGRHAYSRAYINFIHQEEIFIFKEKFDGYVFVDSKGGEFPAVVEFAPFQKVPKKKSKRCDSKSGTIEQDPDYQTFLESLQTPEVVTLPGTELLLEEIETRERELRANGMQNTTPLIEYIKQKKAERLRMREEKREERKRREIEKKRQKEEDRRRKKVEKDLRDREKAKERIKDVKDRDRSNDDRRKSEPTVKLLKNPERERSKELVKESEIEDRESRHDQLSDKAKFDSGYSRGSASSLKEKDWETEDRYCRLKDKDRDRKDRERLKRDRDDRGRYTSSGKSFSQGFSQDKSKNVYTSRSSEWNREKGDRSGYRSGSATSGTSAGPSSRVNQGKGKSYEKSRESLARVRSEVKGGTLPRDTSTKEIALDTTSNKNEQLQSVGSDCETNPKQMNCDNLSTQEQNFEADGENPESEHYLKERSSKGDPRTERRIRNKDRPSMELYRPGMRRVSSLQRNSPQKESSSSSPSPTTVQRTKGPCSVEEEIKEDAYNDDDGELVIEVCCVEQSEVDIADEEEAPL